MQLDTIPVRLGPTEVRAYLDKLDERGEVYSFLIDGDLVLSLEREGSNDCLRIHLGSDGSWFATHVVVVGNKLT